MRHEKKSIFIYLISRLNEKTDQVGKTTVQKMLYFLKRKEIVDYEYTLYHYGPYSFEVENELKQLKSSGILDISWDPDKGYFIKLAEDDEANENDIEKNVKKVIDDLIEKFGQKKAKELSLIATVLYFYDTLPEREIINTVKNLKPQFSEKEIKEALNIVKIVF